MKPTLPTAATATWHQIRNQEQQDKHSWEYLSQVTCSGQDCAHTWWPLVPSTAATADWATSRASGQYEWETPDTALCAIPAAHLFILKEQQPQALTFAPAIRTATTIFREALYMRRVSKQINKWERVMHPRLTVWHVWQLHSASAWRNRLRE